MNEPDALHNEGVLKAGVYPASVTPFDAKGDIDMAATARLLAWFEACGCTGVVLAGTNGEGPSLSAIEKRDLVREAMPLRGKLDIILGVATSSLEEGVWSCNQAMKAGAVAALVMAPSYFREASEDGIVEWFLAMMDRTDMPVIIYNFPQRTGITISSEMLARVSQHERFAGVKDSSGSRENLSDYAGVLKGSNKALYVGNETLLLEALENGWTGTISGASNVMSSPLSSIVSDWHNDQRESAEAKFAIALPAIEALRGKPQPATNKGLLADIGVLPSAAVRLPLNVADPSAVKALRNELETHLGPLDAQSRLTSGIRS
jgi:4-hydroxy-tetrahydrodipicolinate synthase